MVNIYVLELTGGKYYVGKTNHTLQRFNQHNSGSGAKWTQKYKVIDLHAYHKDMKDSDENRITIQMMKQYGVRNVRGGSWTKVNMSDKEISNLESKIKGRRRKVKRRPRRACSRCGRTSHSVNACYARFHANGKSLERKKRVSEKEISNFLKHYRTTRVEIAEQDPNLAIKDVEIEVKELNSLHSESPEKIVEVMETFSEEESSPKYDTALHATYYGLIEKLEEKATEAIKETVDKAFDKAEKQVKKTAKKIGKFGKKLFSKSKNKSPK